MKSLDTSQEDAIKELFNLSIGRVVSSLSNMVDAEVSFSVPEFQILERRQLKDLVAGYRTAEVDVVAMSCRMLFSDDGDGVTGLTLLVVPKSSMPPLLNLLVGRALENGEDPCLERKALQEMGDLLLYTCASNMSQFLATEIEGSEATPLTEEGDAMTNLESGADSLLAELQVQFHLAQHGEVQGSLILFLDLARIPLLQQELNRILVGVEGQSPQINFI